MPQVTKKIPVWALLLIFVFLAAQFHTCAHIAPAKRVSHLCSICATIGVAITIFGITFGLAPAFSPVEQRSPHILNRDGLGSEILARAPPTI